MVGLRAFTSAFALAIAAACSGQTEDQHAAPSDAQADAGAAGSAGSGGSAGARFIDAAGPDTRDVGTQGCAPTATLAIESEDGGAWCSSALPDFPRLDLNRIAVQVPTAEGERWIHHVPSAEHCDSDANPGGAPAFYFYESDGGTRIGLCPSACALVLAEGSGKIRVLQGCAS